MELPAGTQTTVVGATAGAAVGVAAEYFVAQRGNLSEYGASKLAKSAALGGTTGALAINAWAGKDNNSLMFNFGTLGFVAGLGYSLYQKDMDSLIRNIAIGSTLGGSLGYLSGQYGLLGRFGRRSQTY
jgi:hypothetical protein